jgi:hypothetical protein
MNTFKVLLLTAFQLIKQAWFLPRTIVQSARQRQRQAARDLLEAERLDRIRNPSKYLGV